MRRQKNQSTSWMIMVIILLIQGIETLIDLILFINNKFEKSILRNRTVFIAKTADGVRSVDPLFVIVRALQNSPNRGKTMGDIRRRRFLLVTVGCEVERYVREYTAWNEWGKADGHVVVIIMYDLLKAVDHVTIQRLIDAAVRSSFSLRQIWLSAELFQGSRHVELSDKTDE